MEDYLDPLFLIINAAAVPIAATATTTPTITYRSVLESPDDGVLVVVVDFEKLTDTDTVWPFTENVPLDAWYDWFMELTVYE